MDIEDSFSRTTLPLGSTLDNLSSVLRNLACPHADLFILLTLCLAITTINTLIHPSIILQCIADFLLIACTCIFTRQIVTALTFYVERHFIMKTDKALYLTFSSKTSVEYFLCSSLILLSWFLFIRPDITSFAIHFITSTLATFVIASGMWMSKILMLKILDCRFHEKKFFPTIQALIYHEYVLQTLLGPSRGTQDSNDSTMKAQLRWIKGAFANMQFLFCTRLHTISDALHNSNFGDEHQVENVISLIFENLTNNELRNIKEDSLLRFMRKEDILTVLQLFEGAATTKTISEPSLRKWMVKICNERKHVVHLLNDTSNVIQQLDKIVLVNLYFLLPLVWSFLLGVGTTKILVYMSSHLLVLVYIFGDYGKMICEGIMLAIVMHPFDIGDHCIIDNEQLVVEEMGLISTVFLKDNNEKMNYLNSILLTKSISNLNRSFELKDTFELLVSSTTSSAAIAVLKLKIHRLLGSKPESWSTEHSLDLKGINNGRHKYTLEITRATNFKNYKEKGYERSELIGKLRKILEELNIKNYTIQ